MTRPLEADEFLARYADGERDFSGSNLTKVILVQAHVPGLDLTNADLTGAIFYMVNLSGSCLRGACLRQGLFFATKSAGVTAQKRYSLGPIWSMLI